MTRIERFLSRINRLVWRAASSQGASFIAFLVVLAIWVIVALVLRAVS